MSYYRVKTIKGHKYIYEQRSVRKGKKVVTVHVKYIGEAWRFRQYPRFSDRMHLDALKGEEAQERQKV